MPIMMRNCWRKEPAAKICALPITSCSPRLGHSRRRSSAVFWGKRGNVFALQPLSGVITAGILKSAKISTPTTTASFWTAPKSPSATMYSLPPTAPSPRRGIRWIPNSGTRDWSMPTPSLWATTYTAGPVCSRCCAPHPPGCRAGPPASVRSGHR